MVELDADHYEAIIRLSVMMLGAIGVIIAAIIAWRYIRAADERDAFSGDPDKLRGDLENIARMKLAQRKGEPVKDSAHPACSTETKEEEKQDDNHFLEGESLV